MCSVFLHRLLKGASQRSRKCQSFLWSEPQWCEKWNILEISLLCAQSKTGIGPNLDHRNKTKTNECMGKPPALPYPPPSFDQAFIPRNLSTGPCACTNVSPAGAAFTNLETHGGSSKWRRYQGRKKTKEPMSPTTSFPPHLPNANSPYWMHVRKPGARSCQGPSVRVR